MKRRRGSLGLPHMPVRKEMDHPSQFASSLRKDNLGSSMGSLHNIKDLKLSSASDHRQHQFGGSRRDLLGGSMSCLKNGSYLQIPNGIRRNSRNYSTDSLDCRRNSWDPGRRGSSGSSCRDEPIWENNNQVINLMEISSCC